MISFLKKYGLGVGLKTSKKRNKTVRSSFGYAHAKNILIYFTSDGNQKIALVKGIQNKMEREGKKVKFLFLLLNEEDKPDVHIDDGMERLEMNDFSFFGNIQKPSVRNLLNEDFDYMIHADMETNIFSDLIMAKCNAKCRIGRYFKDHDDRYDMMVSIPGGKDINFLLDQIHHYTKAL
jgi:hypothetical protein